MGIEQWRVEFNLLSDASNSFAPRRRAGAQSFAALTLKAPSLNMAGLDLVPGDYEVEVIAEDGLGRPSARSTARVSVVAGSLGSIKVFPNPWKVNLHRTDPISFDMLTSDSEVSIFTLSGHHVKTLAPPVNGTAPWDLRNEKGQPVASGIYLYTVKDPAGDNQKGRFAIIR
jgi:hypothetical protein